MNESRPEHEAVKRLLESAGIPEPSRQLRDRVTAAARQAWEQTAADIPWQIPVRRLALSAAAAIVIVCLASHADDLSMPARRFEAPFESAAAQVQAEGNDTIETGVGSRRFRMAAVQLRGTRIDVEAIRDRMERLRSFLNETPPHDGRPQPAPDKGQSRLLPTWGDYGVYS